jgi:hypothetical protein
VPDAFRDSKPVLTRPPLAGFEVTTEGLETWVRRRLRSAIWKQWKRGRVRYAELRKRGMGTALAAQTAASAHGPWRLANSPALALALPNAYFDSLGIPRLTGSR